MRFSTILSVLAFTSYAAAQHDDLDARDIDHSIELTARAAHARAYADAYDEALAHYRRTIPSRVFARNTLQCQGQPGLCQKGRCMVNIKAQGKKMDCGACRGEMAQCSGSGPKDPQIAAMEAQAGGFKVGSKKSSPKKSK
ncbi:unnamed protein product [Clonostachys byssicola]|uniref:Uncharacterized protein n=1 Tax=Clonostachys byssicola TaxID=160290 RepID=A0A9N9UH87_9HYPO|nr:unnamed protein product [Clonostachys byssicola]